MKSIKRFSSFEELKASEQRKDAEEVIRTRHRAFEKLMGFIRSAILRKGTLAKS